MYSTMERLLRPSAAQIEEYHYLTDDSAERVIRNNRPNNYVPFTYPIHPDLSITQSRQDTFKRLGWPRALSQCPIELAQAGFFYTGRGDAVTCFSCNKTIGQWNKDDNPWIEHAIWSPVCKHVLLMKGSSFVKSTDKQFKERLEKYKPPGYVKESLSRKSIDCKKISRLLFKSAAIEPKPPRRACVVCLDQEITVIFLVCGHFVCCSSCATTMKDCPLCRKPIDWLFRVFYA